MSNLLFLFVWIACVSLCCGDHHHKQSDGVSDPCPKGWRNHGHNCYRMFGTGEFNVSPMDWNFALGFCIADAPVVNGLGGHLVSILSQEENNFITKLVGGIRVWTGGKRLQTDRNRFGWTAATGELEIFSDTPLFQNWKPGEPNDQDAVEDCVEMYDGKVVGRWNDIQCSRRKPFVCEFNARYNYTGSYADKP